MRKRNFILLYGVLFLTLGLFVFLNPEKAYSGIPFSLGCCLQQNGTSSCLGCGEFGERCAVPQQQCLDDLNGDFFQGGSFCTEGTPGEARCLIGGPSEGCCVFEDGDCSDNVTVSSCGGDLWYIGSPCSEILQCTQRETVPTMSTWGIIAMAGILGIVGFIVIRKRMASA